MSTRDSGTGSKLWLLPAAVLVAAGLASLIAQVWMLPGVDAQDWREPAEYVLERVGAQDAVTVQPSWNEDPYPYLTDIGAQAVRQSTPLLEDIYARDQLWLLSETSRLDDALARMPFEAADQEAFGPVTVVRMVPPDSPRITYDLLAELSSAEVTRLKPDGQLARRCKNWRAQDRAWYCGRPDKWIYVGEELLDIGGEPHRCIWAHPPAGKKRVRVRYSDVPLGQQFRFRVGLNQRAVRSERGTDVQVRVSVGEEFQIQKTVPARVTRWEPIEFDTSALAGQTRDVSVEVWSESVYDRYFCFNGWALQ